MFAFFAKIKNLLLFIMLCFLPIVAIYVQNRYPMIINYAVKPIVDTAGFVQIGLVNGFGKITDWYEKYYNSVEYYDEIASLRSKQQEFEALRITLVELENENERLRSLIKLSKNHHEHKMIAARIIGRFGSPMTKMIRINQGHTNGIKRGNGVITSTGVVGRILNVGRYSSDVLLLTDSKSSIDVATQSRSGRGIMKGLSSLMYYRAKVDDFDNLSKVKVNDILVTTGLEKSFPGGIPIGKIKNTSKSQNGLYLSAVIEPFVDFANIENVMIFIEPILDKTKFATDPG